jgi:hypothetical protein
VVKGIDPFIIYHGEVGDEDVVVHEKMKENIACL